MFQIKTEVEIEAGEGKIQQPEQIQKKSSSLFYLQSKVS
jgi:hypothetical protein